MSGGRRTEAECKTGHLDFALPARIAARILSALAVRSLLRLKTGRRELGLRWTGCPGEGRIHQIGELFAQVTRNRRGRGRVVRVVVHTRHETRARRHSHRVRMRSVRAHGSINRRPRVTCSPAGKGPCGSQCCRRRSQRLGRWVPNYSGRAGDCRNQQEIFSVPPKHLTTGRTPSKFGLENSAPLQSMINNRAGQ